MKVEFSILVKVLLSVTGLFFVVGFSSLFFPAIEAEVIEVRQLAFHQQGYDGLPYSNFNGSTSSLLLASYEYEVNETKYNGWGLIKGYGEERIFVKYFPLAPSISISSSAPYLLMSFFLFFISLGIRSFIVWCKKIAYGHTS